jgi:hypothetical protein
VRTKCAPQEDAVLGLWWSKRPEQHGRISIFGVLRLRATKRCVTRSIREALRSG